MKCYINEPTKMKQEVVLKSKWLTIKKVGRKPKTNIYAIESNSSECVLGFIQWDCGWRKYAFTPTIEFKTKYGASCLVEMGLFIIKINKEHNLQERSTR